MKLPDYVYDKSVATPLPKEVCTTCLKCLPKWMKNCTHTKASKGKDIKEYFHICDASNKTWILCKCEKHEPGQRWFRQFHNANMTISQNIELMNAALNNISVYKTTVKRVSEPDTINDCPLGYSASPAETVRLQPKKANLQHLK